LGDLTWNDPDTIFCKHTIVFLHKPTTVAMTSWQIP